MRQAKAKTHDFHASTFITRSSFLIRTVSRAPCAPGGRGSQLQRRQGAPPRARFLHCLFPSAGRGALPAPGPGPPARRVVVLREQVGKAPLAKRVLFGLGSAPPAKARWPPFTKAAAQCGGCRVAAAPLSASVFYSMVALPASRGRRRCSRWLSLPPSHNAARAALASSHLAARACLGPSALVCWLGPCVRAAHRRCRAHTARRPARAACLGRRAAEGRRAAPWPPTAFAAAPSQTLQGRRCRRRRSPLMRRRPSPALAYCRGSDAGPPSEFQGAPRAPNRRTGRPLAFRCSLAQTAHTPQPGR